jgi:hypothetical protein
VPKIMIRCPTLGGKVPTGLTTEMVVFGSLPVKIKLPLRCPACRNVHAWAPKDAWIDKAAYSGNPGSSTLSVLTLLTNDSPAQNRDQNERERRRA